MQFVSLGDNLHEMSNPFFYDKKKKKKKKRTNKQNCRLLKILTNMLCVIGLGFVVCLCRFFYVRFADRKCNVFVFVKCLTC